jgi:hypothetical protein
MYYYSILKDSVKEELISHFGFNAQKKVTVKVKEA